MGAPASERRLAASEDPRRNGLKHLTHTRSDEIRCTTTLEKLNLNARRSAGIDTKLLRARKLKQNTCLLRLRTHTSQEIFSFLVCPSGGGALFSPHFMRRERAFGMHSTAPNTQTCLLSVHCACNTMDGDVSATCTAKRARPASQASGLAPDRPCRLQATLFVLTNADGDGSTSWRAATSCQ